MNYFDSADVHLETARGARLGANRSSDDYARFTSQSLEGLKCFRLLFLRYDTLDHARAVAKNRKEELARFALVIKPALDRHRAIDMLSGMFDGDDGSSCLLWLSHPPACFLF